MIPKFNEMMLPILQFIKKNGTSNMNDFLVVVKQNFPMSKEEIEKLIPSGTQTILYNRVAWACSYLKQAQLIEKIGRGTYKLSKDGEQAAESNEPLTVKSLNKYKSFIEFMGKSKSDSESVETEETVEIEEKTSREIIQENFNKINDVLIDDLLSEILSMKPKFLEKLVVDLLVKMGYGSDEENWERTVTPYSNDGGVDGIISEDRLGLDKVYVQAKRYKADNIIGTQQLDQFVGALAKFGAKKGVYITTSSFSKNAQQYQPLSDIKIVKIDGRKLCRYMIEYNLGVVVETKIEIKKLDENYFPEDFKE